MNKTTKNVVSIGTHEWNNLIDRLEMYTSMLDLMTYNNKYKIYVSLVQPYDTRNAWEKKNNFTQVVWPKVLLNDGTNRIYFPCVVCRNKQIKIFYIFLVKWIIVHLYGVFIKIK